MSEPSKPVDPRPQQRPSYRPVRLACPGCGIDIEMGLGDKNRILRFDPGSDLRHHCPARNVSRTHDRKPDGYSKPLKKEWGPRPAAWRELDQTGSD